MLGVSWAPTTDHLVVETDQLVQLGSSLPETKRSILKITARFYDPLGLLNPVSVRAKMMLKTLWKEGKGWDEALPGAVQCQWRKWFRELRTMGKFSVPRNCALAERPYQIHVFCDASKEAYAAVLYIRSEHSEQCASTYLLISKSRLSPSQEMSIPRLELTAALIGARLLAYVKKKTANCAAPEKLPMDRLHGGS